MLDILTTSGPHHLLVSCIAACIGLLIGSFLNVVIYRIPIMMQREADNAWAAEMEQPPPHSSHYNLFVPRSQCPHCHTSIAVQHNIPLLSYIALRGRCHSCRAPISLRYPIVELASALLSAVLIWHFGWNHYGAAALLLGWFLLALSVIDIQTQLLPDDLTLPLLWLGLLFNLHAGFVPLSDAVIGAVAGYVVLWTIYWTYKLFTGKEGMGYGDFKLIAALGAWTGWQTLPFVLLLACCSAALFGIVLLILKKNSLSDAMPFGPWLAMAGVLTLLYGDAILNEYLKQFS